MKPMPTAMSRAPNPWILYGSVHTKGTSENPTPCSSANMISSGMLPVHAIPTDPTVTTAPSTAIVGPITSLCVHFATR